MKPWRGAAVAIAVFCTAPFALAADYAPLDCTQAKTAAEETVCASYALGQAEARMATLYATAASLVAMGQRGDIGDAQRQWLQRRDTCGRDVACLSRAYRNRIGQLNAVIAAIASRGPY
ncbi:MAG: lysozyme inhibitor LprI family protein [Xanthobacteraceae bacterium]